MRGHSIYPSPHRGKIKSLLTTSVAGRLGRRSARRGVFFLSLIFLLAAAVNFGSSAAVSVGSGPLTGALPGAAKAKAAPVAAPAGGVKKERTALTPAFEPLAAAPLFQTTTPSIETYDCTTGDPKTEFTLGQKVCARATGAPSGLLFPWRVSFVAPAGYIVQSESAHPDPQTEYDYTLPAGITSTLLFDDGLGGTTSVLYKTRGTWRATLTRASGAIYATASFSVSDPAAAVADVFVRKYSQRGLASITAGNPIAFEIIVANAGPNAAQSVHLTDAAPEGATLTSFTQESGPTCTPANTDDCTIATLGARQVAKFVATYGTGGMSNGTALTSASVTTTTAELDTTDNTAEAKFEVTGADGEGAACSLECPNDIVVTATHVVEGVTGATVEFETEPSGDCGPVTSSFASGSFFPVGTHVVSSSASGGGSCSFTVKVIDPATLPAPAITCPPDKSAVAASGALDATVDVGTPTTTGTVLSVTAIRSDGVARATTDPYSVGETVITWIARDQAPDADGQFPPLTRAATCQQKVVVTSNDVPTISCPTDKTFAAPSGSCEITLTAAQIGTPTATGLGLGPNDPPADGVGVEGVRSDRRSLTDPFSGGVTTITWTATDSVGRVVSCTQTITITTSGDNTPPVLNVPPDVEAFTDSCTAVVDDELGVATATDSCGGGVKISRTGVPTGSVIIRRRFPLPPLIVQRETFIFPVGTTNITYTATDASGNTTTGTQKVTVKERTATPPNIALNGPASMTVECHTSFTDPGATASDNCGAATITTSGSVNVNTPGPYVITYTATDASGYTASVERTVTVVDTIAPVVTMNGPASMTHECHTPFTDLGASAADSCDTSVPVNVSSTLDVNVPGIYTITYGASDDSGNPATPVIRTVTVVDTTPPVISCPTNVVVYLPLNSTAVSMPVSFTAPTATDSCDMSVPVTTSHASGAVFPVGTTTVTASATDDSGNPASCSFTVTVLYNFTGFFSPVANLPVLNNVNAGRAIPLKFSLSGNKGLGIMAAGFPASQQIACNTSAPLADLEGTESSGGSTLTYSATSDQYHYNWKTESSWAGTCRVLVVKLNDGTEHTALFKFK